MESIPTPPNPFVADAGSFVLPSLAEWFFLPGDWLIYFLASRAPALAGALDVGPADYGGTLAGFLAWIFWVGAPIASIAGAAAVRRFDENATRRIAYAAAELRRRVRMTIAMARYRRGRRLVRHEPSFDVEELPSLRRDELLVLGLHLKLAPGFALTADDVAEDLDRRGHEIRAVLERLQKLRLLQATVGGLDGETAYTLTAAGRAVLRLHHARPRTA
jgi:hypothetical protein